MIYELLLAQKKPVRRAELARLCGLTDRQMRRQIAEERKAGRPIVNMQDGSGYFVGDWSSISVQIDLNNSRIKELRTMNRRFLSLLGERKYSKHFEQLKLEF